MTEPDFRGDMPILALVGVDEVELFETLQNPVVKVARLQHASPESILDPDFALDGVIIVVGPTPAVSMEPVPAFRQAHPRLPIFIASDALEVDEAVELMHAGVTDVLTLPVDPPVWKGKFMREFLGSQAPVKTAPILKPFHPDTPMLALPSSKPFTRRQVPRADVPPQLAAKARLLGDAGEGVAELLDFSIAMAGRPGGARLRVDPESAQNLDVAHWSGKTALGLAFALPGMPEITGRAEVVPPVRQIGEDGSVAFAIQYTLDDMSHAGAARRFWSACCDRVLRPTQPWVVPTV